MSTVAVVGCAAGGVEQVRSHLVLPLRADEHVVTVTLTPAAATWLGQAGELDQLEAATGFPVRCTPRLPTEQSPHPRPDLLVVAPATANSVAKIALGISDNQALTLVCENISTTPVIVFPRINAAHARHPAWEGYLAALRGVGVHLIYGDDVWPLYEPRDAPSGRDLPWPDIVRTAKQLLS